ncbi:hypothetical protein FUAX_17620 [Fulvitalea axinellae]|uniref:SusD/RagB family nutrient-binding outer membrane lipoprotein n=1 Tax=Fulvitalea axinellae TaxID=1182444 RepID=A0AAU9DAI9_9BACT|nr:hypothetical protein FUAX_17620 [Fulvitalea axinellae]
MTSRYLNIPFLALIFSFCLFSCERDFEEFNTNGNALEEVSPVFQVGEITRDLHQSYSQSYNVGSEWQHQWARSYGDTRGYIYDNGQAHAWKESYAAYRDIVDLIGKVEPGTAEENPVIYSVALVAKVFHFHMLTDLYGDVPYTEAGQGASGLVKPGYTAQNEIYSDLFASLDEAIALLDGADNLTGLNDIDRLYAGEAEKWLRFANSLRLRMGMRVRYADPALAEREVGKALAEKLIEENEHNAKVFEFESQMFQKEKENMMHPSVFMVDFMAGDPRYDLYFGPNTKGEIIGYVNGSVETQGDFSRIGQGIAIKDRPDRIMGASEVAFLLAEAHLFGIGTANDTDKANEAYRKGIRTSMEFWGVEAGPIEEFLTKEKTTLSGTDEEKLEMVIMQKWADLIDNGVETYAEGRRTGYPVIAQRKDAGLFVLGDTDGVMPRKCKYPESEAFYNTENFQKMSAQHDFLTKVWWDKK